MLTILREGYMGLRQGDRTTWACALLGVVAMLAFIASGAFGQYPIVYPQQPTNTNAIQGQYHWYAVEGNRNTWMLWRGNEYVGTLDPDLAQWQFAWEAKPQDMSLKLDKFWRDKGQNRRDTGAGALLKGDKKPPLEGKAGIREESDRDPINERPPVDGGDGLTPMARFKGNNFGVDYGGIGKDHIGYSINGKAVGASEALDAIRDGGLPNDTELPRLIVIGNDAARKKVLADIDTAPDLAAFKGKIVVQGYPPGHWHVSAERGFVQPVGDGVVIQAQTAGGKVLWRQENYNGGAPELARALRDRVPGYDPAKDPQPKTPSVPEDAAPKVVAWAGALGCPASFVALLGGIALWLRKRKAS